MIDLNVKKKLFEFILKNHFLLYIWIHICKILFLLMMKFNWLKNIIYFNFLMIYLNKH